MSSTTFILLGVTYYVVALIIIIVVLNIINRREKKKYQARFALLERDKNLIISAGILSELNKVENMINSDAMQKLYANFKSRFEDIKNNDIPKISDDLEEIVELFSKKDYKSLQKKIANTEYEIYYIKTKSNGLLNEIKEITLSEDRNREIITKLKAKYREVINKYNNNKNEYESIKGPLELQFENIDKLFSAFEVTIDNNNYLEAGKIVKGLEDVVGNIKLVIDEAPMIIVMSEKVIPSKIKDILNNAAKMQKEGFNLDYLNLEYNFQETNKKLDDILTRLNVLNIEDSTFDLNTINTYLDELYNVFNKERDKKNSFEEYVRKILVKTNKYERINNDLSKKINDFKYSYDLTDEDLAIIPVIKMELKGIKSDYEKIVSSYRSKTFAYSKLNKEMEYLNGRLLKTKEKLDFALKNLGSLKEDEIRARQQLKEIKEIFNRSKEKISSYKLPVIPKNYYVELSEASEAIKEMVQELNKQPISIKTLNVRVDTARDLVLKLYNTAKVLAKSCYMAETAIVYGNRFRPINESIDKSLNQAENLFNKGNFKESLECSIKAISEVEPDFYDNLKETVLK